jgi:glutathione S-transferase
VHPATVITLYTMPGTSALESLSPFCMKVEVYLKLQKIPYRARVGDPRKAPKGKMPFIVEGDAKIADSSAIFDYLETKSDHPLDRGLDAAGRARAHVLQRTLEESLYWPLLWSRWADDDGWNGLRPYIEALVPAPLRWFVPALIRKKIVAATVAQGIGRHTRDEIFGLGTADIAAIASALGEREYLVDDQLRTIDVIAYSFLKNIMLWSPPTPLSAAAAAVPALQAYVKRIGARVEPAPSA